MNRAEVQINAWIGGAEEGARGLPSDEIEQWAIRGVDTLRPHQVLFAESPPKLEHWEEVGWGIILPDIEADGEADRKRKANAEDAPPAIQRLLAARREVVPDCPVLRYRPDLGSAYFMLYEADGTARKIATAGGEVGAGKRRLPRYLLIVGSPSEIPWRVQYVLNGTHFVGRLDLPELGLDRYVAALLDNWSASPASRRSVLIWTVDHGQPDITWDMRYTLAEPLRSNFAHDPDVTPAHLAADEASCDALTESLEGHPGLIVTTSHGATFVDGDPAYLRETLGLPVDQNYEVLRTDQLSNWSPDGAIWYAHACCSAGADSSTLYGGIAKQGSDVDKAVTGVTVAGSCTAPLPRDLLGREHPLRAFVGHVEPTFNWTLKNPENAEPMTSDLRGALYDGLFQEHGEPIGMAMHRHYATIGTFWSVWYAQQGSINRGVAAARERALVARLAALDRQSMVILGDPTVTVQQD
ncbi:hypothetical protein [Marmoricola sp. URHB0036]|uniref:hypothetical protein n=1 Tax=Marmoricola sp. URHB0036 TaxID=1298863 RepID=UPI000489AA6D|nr:hypothetical protein [Marmoricola sp. URHB0036]